MTLAALADAEMPPLLDDAPKAPQILAGAGADVVTVDEGPPFPLFKLAAREASPLSAVMLALGAGRALLFTLSGGAEDEEEGVDDDEAAAVQAGASLMLVELRDFAGDFNASAEGVIVMLPANRMARSKHDKKGPTIELLESCFLCGQKQSCNIATYLMARL